MLESLAEESSWKILRKNPFTLYITVFTCIGLAFLGYYTGTIIRLLCIQDDFQSLLKEVFLGPSIVWSIFGAAIGCLTNPAMTIFVADMIIFIAGGVILSGNGLFVAKLFIAIGIGMISTASPRSMSRVSEATRIRGFLVRLLCFCFAIGGCLTLCHGLFATTQEPERTTNMILVTAAPALLQALLITIVNPDSPLWDFIKDGLFFSGTVKFNGIQSVEQVNMDGKELRIVNAEP